MVLGSLITPEVRRNDSLITRVIKFRSTRLQKLKFLNPRFHEHLIRLFVEEKGVSLYVLASVITQGPTHDHFPSQSHPFVSVRVRGGVDLTHVMDYAPVTVRPVLEVTWFFVSSVYFFVLSGFRSGCLNAPSFLYLFSHSSSFSLFEFVFLFIRVPLPPPLTTDCDSSPKYTPLVHKDPGETLSDSTGVGPFPSLSSSPTYEVRCPSRTRPRTRVSRV